MMYEYMLWLYVCIFILQYHFTFTFTLFTAIFHFIPGFWSFFTSSKLLVTIKTYLGRKVGFRDSLVFGRVFHLRYTINKILRLLFYLSYIYFIEITNNIGLTSKEVTMLIDKISIEIVHWTSFWSFFDLGIVVAGFAVIRHLVDIVCTRDIRFSGKFPSISKLWHT